MTSDSAKKVLEEQARLERQIATVVCARPLEIDRDLHRLVEETRQHQELIRAALGPLENLRHSSTFDDAVRGAEEMVESMRRASEFSAQLQASFRMPKVGETARLLRDVEWVSNAESGTCGGRDGETERRRDGETARRRLSKARR